MIDSAPRRNLQRVLAACTGGDAAVIVRSVQAMGLEVIAAFDESSAEAPWVEQADWDAPLLVRDPDDDPWSDPQRLVSAALDAGADALHPGAGTSAASGPLARLTTASGLAWLGVQAELLETWATAVPAAAAATGIGLRTPDDPRPSTESAVRVGVLGDGTGAILLGQQRLLTAGLAEVGPCPEPLARAAITLAVALRLRGLASFDLVAEAGGRVILQGAHPSLSGWFMFDEALGADLVAAQIQLASGEALHWDTERPEVRPTVAAVVRSVADCDWTDPGPLDGVTNLAAAGHVARSTPLLLLARSAPTLLAARVQLGEALRACCPLPHTNAAALRARLFADPA